MATGRELYFAYDAHLRTDVMVARCPAAADPRPAVLADHDWLISRRGVATIEPFPGSEVHGAVWSVTGRDLAALDAAAGGHETARRRRHTLATANGPVTAWTHADHHPNPGAPQLDYLEQVVTGAAERGLPARWIEYLRRWDPSHWPQPNGGPSAAAPRSLPELLATEGVEEWSMQGSRFGFMAIHGGDVERMTDTIAERAAQASGASVYLVRHPEGYPDHLTSTHYLASASKRLAAFLDHVDVVVSLHGYFRFGRGTHLLAGGSNRSLAAHVARCVELPGFQVVTDLDAIPPGLRGMHADNPVNRPRGGGCQLELPPRVRGLGPRSSVAGEDGLSAATAALVRGLAEAARSWAAPA